MNVIGTFKKLSLIVQVQLSTEIEFDVLQIVCLKYLTLVSVLNVQNNESKI